MKPIPAIVDNAIVRAGRKVDSALRAYSAAEANAKERRLELGRALIEARQLYPKTGRNAGGWSRFVAERGLNMDVALDAMKYAGWVEINMPDYEPGKSDPDSLPTREGAGLDKPAEKGSAGAGAFPDPSDDDDRDLGPSADIKPANVNGGSGEKPRGAWCTPEKWARAVGPWDLDPFSNPRSLIVADQRCMLEDGGDGLANPALPGAYRVGPEQTGVARPDTRVWIQPPYERGFVERVIAHYGHTRFCALLRWSPDTGWFEQLWPLVKVVAFPIGERLDFDPPPGVPESSTPHAHAFHYADPRDVTEEIARTCIVLSRYEALRLVR